MQPKVSVVIPCYNKAGYVGNLFNSIIAQKWNNIELIIVNDGSSDGTREVIEDWLPRFRWRGYGIVVVDQVNQGVAGAVLEGLKRITGEFICQVDADDELAPEYISTMAGWLDIHPEDKWVYCEYGSKHMDFGIMPEETYEKHKTLMEDFLLFKEPYGVGVSMVRTSYADETRMLDNYVTEFRITQEPQFYLPLIIGGAKPVHIRRSLYYAFARESSIVTTARSSIKSINAFTDAYSSTTAETLKRCGVDISNEKIAMSLGVGHYYHKYLCAVRADNPEVAQYCETLSYELHEYLENGTTLNIKKDELFSAGIEVFVHALRKYMEASLYSNDKTILQNGKIIGYGVLGKAARRITKSVVNSPVSPTVFWDISAKESMAIENIQVTIPDFSSLSPCDVVLFLIKDQQITESVIMKLRRFIPRKSIFVYNEVLDLLAKYYFKNLSRGL